MGIIYMHTSPSGKSYIGQSINSLEERWKSHISSASAGRKSRFNNAIRKYGPENFKSVVLEEVDNTKLNEREIFYIQYFDTYYNGYNATFGGDSCGHKLSKDAKQKMSVGTQHYWDNLSEKERENHRKSCSKSTTKQWKNGTKEERKAIGKAISESLKGRVQQQWVSDEHSKRMTGAGNSKAKKIFIYDINDTIMFKCHGNFRKVCKENNLPHNALRISYNRGGKRIIQSNRSFLMAKTKGWTEYIGWYAKVID